MKRLSLDEAVALLQSGEVVALPTETVYGLAARADRTESVQKIFHAKGRPAHNPLICHISSVEMLERYAVIRSEDRPLFSLWPGPLTLLLPKIGIPDVVTAGSALCAFRMPSHPLFLEAITKTGVPLAAPSANLSGKTSPVTAQMVEESLEGRIPGVVDGGPCSIGIESTVVLREGRSVRILRPGAITEKDFEALGFTVQQGQPDHKDPQGRGLLSPGRLPVHYAPAVPLIFVEECYTEDLLQRLHRFLQGENDLFQVLEERLPVSRMDCRQPALLQPEPDAAAFASKLYRSLDTLSRSASVILSFRLGDDGMGRAVNDRLRRAASLRLSPSDTGSGR